MFWHAQLTHIQRLWRSFLHWYFISSPPLGLKCNLHQLHCLIGCWLDYSIDSRLALFALVTITNLTRELILVHTVALSYNFSSDSGSISVYFLSI